MVLGFFQYGSSVTPFADKRISHKPGWAFVIVGEECYDMGWQNALQISNISYNGAFYYFQVSRN